MLKGHKILLTGLTGQVGGAFADQLAPHNEVWGLARYSHPGSRERVEAAGVRTVVGDYASGDFGDLPDDFDYVLHLGANTKPGTAEVAMVQNAEGTGLLMHHCRKAGAFLFVSNTSLYDSKPDPMHRYVETDDVGGQSQHSPNYGPSKLASEGAVRVLARLFNIPTTIARLNVSYGGAYDDGGLPGNYLEMLIAGAPIRISRGKPLMFSPIHEDDMVRHLEPMLKAASVPATIVNWGGDVSASAEDVARHLAGLIGVEPKFDFVDGGIPPSRILDPTFGRSLGMEWLVPWKDGMRRMVQARHPEIALRG